MAAPGTSAPEASEMVPVMAEVRFCPKLKGRAARRTIAVRRYIVRGMIPPF
jgi:hypothetical protein